MSSIQTKAEKLKFVFEELSLISDAVRGGYAQNKKLIEMALSETPISHHLNLLQIGFLRAVVDCPDLPRGNEYKVLVEALAEFDEALKNAHQSP